MAQEKTHHMCCSHTGGRTANKQQLLEGATQALRDIELPVSNFTETVYDAGFGNKQCIIHTTNQMQNNLCEFHSASEQMLHGQKPWGTEEGEWERRFEARTDHHTAQEETELQNNTGESEPWKDDWRIQRKAWKHNEGVYRGCREDSWESLLSPLIHLFRAWSAIIPMAC